jgi:hypothetical protein
LENKDMAKRIFYAAHQVGFAKDGETTYIEAHGVQSVGVTTNFNLESVFELGQLEVYQIIEQIPDIEVNLEKVIDGYPLLGHLATNGATDGSLVGRSNIKTIIGLSVFSDLMSSASGVPLAEVSMSGMVLSNWSFTIPVQGNITESITCMGNDKRWRDDETLGTAVFDGAFEGNDDEPLDLVTASGNSIQRREHVIMSVTGLYPVDANGAVVGPVSVFPTELYGIGSSGLNPASGDGWRVPIQSITISADLGRETIFELGTRAPYHKFVNFPVEVRSEFEVILVKWDNVSGTAAGGMNGAAAGFNTKYQTIRVRLKDDTDIYCGTRNRLSSVTYQGGDAGGGNVTGRYSYIGQNNLTVTATNDPSGL